MLKISRVKIGCGFETSCVVLHLCQLVNKAQIDCARTILHEVMSQSQDVCASIVLVAAKFKDFH